jgi:hypothetical protein
MEKLEKISRQKYGEEIGGKSILNIYIETFFGPLFDFPFCSILICLATGILGFFLIFFRC